MITFKQFLIEAAAPVSVAPILDMKAGSFFPALSGEGGGADVTVMNPKGAAFNSTTKPTLGMGFEMAPNLVGTVQKFVDKYSNTNTNNGNKATDPKTPATKTPVTWQTTNQAVSNQQKEELNKLLAKFNLTPNTPNAPPPLTKKPPEVPNGGIPVRGQYPAKEGETQEQFAARWAEYMRLRELNERWWREQAERLEREREERQRELDRRQRERERNPNGQSPNKGQSPNGQSPNFVQDPDFVGPPSPEPEIFGPPNPDSITPNGDGSYTLPDWWPHQWQQDPMNPPEPEREANDQDWQDWLARQSQEWLNQNPYPPRQPGMTDAEYEQAREAHYQRHLEYLRSLGYGPGGGGGVGGGGPGQQTGNPGYVSMNNNKPGSKPGVELSPQERLTDKINNIKGTNSDNGQRPQKALLNKNNVRQDPNVFGPPAPMEEPNVFGPPATDDNLFPYHPHDHRWFDNWWKQTLDKLFRERYLRQFGEEGMEDELRRMRETLYKRWKEWLNQGGENGSPDWQLMGGIIRTLHDYFDLRGADIYA